VSEQDYATLARYYDLEHGAFQDDFALYLGFAARTGSPLLEFGCGTGRLLVALAEAGFDITGVDVSPAMLDLARAKLAGRPGLPGKVDLVQADAREVDLPGRYALAFWALNSIMHLPSQADQQRALARAHALLRGGGLLILDLFQPDPQLLVEADGRLLHDASWPAGPDGRPVVRFSSRRLDLAEQTIDVTYFYDELLPDGQSRRYVAPFSMRYLHRFEAQLLLARAGFAVEGLYGSYELDDFDSGSERMILVARKGA
jgi:SAM-dependent methyltransferase